MPGCYMKMEEQLAKSMDEGFHSALINMLSVCMRGLEPVKLSEDQRKGGRVGGNGCKEAGRGGGDEEGRRGEMESGVIERKKEVSADEEKVWKSKVLESLRKLTVYCLDRVTAWREVVKKCECSTGTSPLERSNEQHLTKAGLCDDSLSSIFQSVREDINVIMDKLNTIINRLDAEMMLLCSDQPSDVDPMPQKTSQSQTPSPLDDLHLTSCDPSTFDTGDDGTESGQLDLNTTADTDEVLDSEQHEVNGQRSDNDCASLETDGGGANDKDTNKKDGANLKWIPVGLTGQLDSGHSFIPDACYIRAPVGVSQVLQCEVAEALSCLMVIGSEELVSRVIQLSVRDSAHVSFPISVIIPYYARYRGSYRDISVKVVGEDRRVSYISPVTNDGNYGGQRGLFAEVKVYSLGLFAVISCLKRENYTVPRRGLSFKLSMDPRICLNYLPGSFTVSVMVQAMIQPLDAVLLAAVKSRSEDYRSVVSTSPIVYLMHPSSQPLGRTLTITLPCPPKPKQKLRQLEEMVHCHRQHITASPSWDSTNRIRMVRDSVKSKDMHNEFLVFLGYKDQQWSALEKITVRNQQKGLVSFELTDNFDRLLVVRLLSPLNPSNLVSLVEELEEAVYCHTVTIVLLRQKEDPHAMLVAVVLSKDLTWEVSKLKAQGYSSTPNSTLEITMCEGDQLLLQFSGNITSVGALNNQNEHTPERITFHSQRRNHLFVRLAEVDPFGNHSSSHYKGTAMFYKVNRGQLDWSFDQYESVDIKLLGDPICKLPLTLPKKVRNINRPIVTQVKICEDITHSLSDSLLLWLSGQLSEEEVSRLVVSLRLRRSAAQLVKLRAGNSLSGQAFHVLSMWRRGLPATSHQSNVNHLANCLAKSGRPDLAQELLLTQTADTK